MTGSTAIDEVLQEVCLHCHGVVIVTEILLSFDVSMCVSVCVCVQQNHQSDQFKMVKATDMTS